MTKVVTYEESTDEPTLAGFLEEVALIADIDSLENSSDYVVLMTIHSAKGLEFPRVYLSGMEDGVFPSYMCLNSDDPTDIEEERRLCYVAITRAMKKLIISCARARMVRGETQYNKMSRFVGEIPGYLLDKGTTTGKTSVGAGSFGGFGSSSSFSSGVKTGSSYISSGRGMSAADLFRTSAFDKPKTSIMSKPAFGSSLGSKPAALSKGSEMSKADGLDYGVSDRVKHIKFGVGTVTAINDSGRDYEVTVNFDTAGPKKMFASFAKLKKI